MTFQTTKKQCQNKINELNNVCNRCGRKIIPLRTVNNAGEPTYWSGCMHGQKGKECWGHFTSGVTKEVYNLALKLVLDDNTDFGISYEDRNLKNFNYALENAVDRACSTISRIKWMENNNPRYTKNQLKELYLKNNK